MTLAGSRAECIACNSMQGHGHHGRPVAEDPGHHFDQVTQTHSKRARSDDHTCNATLYDWQSHNPTLRVPVGQHAFIADTTSITLSRKEYDQLQRDLGRALAKNDEMLLRHNLLERLIATKSAECDKLYNMLHQRMASDSAPPAGGDGLIQVQRETLGSAVWSAAWSLLNANGCGQLRQLIRTLGIVLDREVIDSLVDMEASMSATAGSATSARELIEKLLAFPLGRSKFGLYSHLPHSTEDDTQLTQAAFETVIAILARPSLFPQAPDSSTGSASLVICGQPLYTLPSLEQCQAVIDHSDWWRAHDTLQEAMSECVYNAVEPAFSSAAFPHVAGYIRIDGAAAPWLISFADKRVTLFGVVRGTSQHVKHLFSEIVASFVRVEQGVPSGQPCAPEGWTYSSRNLFHHSSDASPSDVHAESRAITFRLLQVLKDKADARGHLESHMLGLVVDENGQVSPTSNQDIQRNMSNVLLKEANLVWRVIRAIRGQRDRA